MNKIIKIVKEVLNKRKGLISKNSIIKSNFILKTEDD